jgi:hypothetical protein
MLATAFTFHAASRISLLDPQQFEVGRSEKWCWSIGGSVSVEGKTGLAVALFGRLGITATIDGNFEHCVELEERHCVATQPLNCFHVYARFRYTIVKVHGTVTEAEAVTSWECHQPGGWYSYAQTECGLKTSEGWADAYGVREFHNTQLPPSCHGPNPPWEMHDGKTSDPCCPSVTSIVGCPDEAPPYCCGCFGEQ